MKREQSHQQFISIISGIMLLFSLIAFYYSTGMGARIEEIITEIKLATAHQSTQDGAVDLGLGGSFENHSTKGLPPATSDNHLKKIEFYYTCLQTVLAGFFFLFIWRARMIYVAFGATGGMIVLWQLNLALFAKGIPIRLQDTLLFSFIAFMVGALWKKFREEQRCELKGSETLVQRNFATNLFYFLEIFSQGLTNINENIFWILTKYDDELTRIDSNKKVYVKLLSSSEDLRDYLTGIKQFSSLTSDDEQFYRKTRFNLLALINRVILQFDGKCIEQNTKLTIECDPKLEIYGTGSVIEHVLHNLVSNAVKYSGKDGIVKIKVIYPDPRDITICVEDNGPGIPEKLHKSIFKKFYRVDDDNLVKIKGNGLGLFLSQFFVNKIDAKLTLKSSCDKGSTFYFHLFGARR